MFLKQIKKRSAFVVLVGLSFGLVACGGSDSSGSVEYNVKMGDFTPQSIVEDIYSIDKNVINLLSRCDNLDIIKEPIYKSETDITNKKHIIDWGHHVLRYYVFEYYLHNILYLIIQ